MVCINAETVFPADLALHHVPFHCGPEQSIAFLFRFRSAYAEMATGTHLQNWLKKELQIGFEEEEREE